MVEQAAGFVNAPVYLIEHRCDSYGFAIGFIPAGRLNRFTNTGQGFGAIAGVHTGRIDLMTIPVAARQSLIQDQRPLAVEHSVLSAGEVSGPDRDHRLLKRLLKSFGLDIQLLQLREDGLKIDFGPSLLLDLVDIGPDGLSKIAKLERQQWRVSKPQQ